MTHKENKIRVRAKAPGIYGQMRDAGAEFHIEDENHFSGKWMEHVDEKGVPVEDSPVHKRYEDWLKDKKEAALAVQTFVPPAPRIPERKTGKNTGSGDAAKSDSLGTFDRGGNRIDNDPANPLPGTPDPGQKAQTEAIVDHKLHDVKDKKKA